MDNVIEKAQDKLASLKRQAAEIEGQIHKWELFLGTYNELAGNDLPVFGGGLTSKKARVEHEAALILGDGIARNSVELFSIIATRNTGLKSSNELSVYLSNNKDKFVSDRRNGWTLKKTEPQNAGT